MTIALAGLRRRAEGASLRRTDYGPTRTRWAPQTSDPAAIFGVVLTGGLVRTVLLGSGEIGRQDAELFAQAEHVGEEMAG